MTVLITYLFIKGSKRANILGSALDSECREMEEMELREGDVFT